jgi:hypothetical protein
MLAKDVSHKSSLVCMLYLIYIQLYFLNVDKYTDDLSVYVKGPLKQQSSWVGKISNEMQTIAWASGYL